MDKIVGLIYAFDYTIFFSIWLSCYFPVRWMGGAIKEPWLSLKCPSSSLNSIHLAGADSHVIVMTQGISWASCQVRKIAGAHAPGMPGTFSPPPEASDPDMHHGTCMTHVPWCMPGSLTSGFLWSRRRGKTFPAFPAHAQPAILRIW